MAFDWNEANLKALREMWALGLTTAEIGRKLGCTKNAVVGKVHRLRLEPRPAPILTAKKRAELDDRRNPEIKRLLHEGYGIAAIRVAVRVNEVTVRRIRDENNIPVRTKHGTVLTRLERAPPRVAAPKPAPRPVIVAPPKPQYTPRKLPGVDACCWPFGEVGTRDFRFCDSADVVPGRPYCKAHAREAYTGKPRPIKAAGNTAIFL